MLLHCPKCKRYIPESDEEVRVGISYCYGCEYYFPSSEKTSRNRKEIIVPHLTSALRLRLEENSITINFRWFGNYSTKVLLENLAKHEGFGVLYSLAILINKTRVHANDKQLIIEHKPMNLLPTTIFDKNYVEQLYVHKLPSMQYGLWAKVKNGEDVLLLYNLDKRVLLYLEQEIERIFGIEDKEILGEIVE